MADGRARRHAMVSEVRIYVEGGGDGAYGKAQIRGGFGQFLRDPAAQARNKRIRWSVIACGSRNDTFDDFKEALRTHPDAFNVLLVDSEGSVAVGLPPWQHLLRRPGIGGRDRTAVPMSNAI